MIERWNKVADKWNRRTQLAFGTLNLKSINKVKFINLKSLNFFLKLNLKKKKKKLLIF